MVSKFVVYGKPNCIYCDKVKMLLDIKSKEYDYIDVTKDDNASEMFIEKGFRSFPQIFQEGEGVSVHIGGFEELYKFLNN